MKTNRLFLTLLLLAGSICGHADSDIAVGNLYFHIGNGEATVTGLADESVTELTIPDKVKYDETDYPVTSIGKYAFEGCTNLTSITIPNSVTSIGYRALYYCSGLTSVSIPNSVTSIGEAAFMYCSGLTLVTIGNSVTSIGIYAFSGCENLTSINIPDSVTSIGEYAFSGCDKLPIINDIRYADTYLVEVVNKSLSQYTIKAGTRLIGKKVFQGCTNLTSITIPNSVTNIGSRAFYGCSSLSMITSEIETPLAFENGAFENISSNCVLYVPVGTSYAYIAAGWTEYVFKGGVVEKDIIFADPNAKVLCVANWDTDGDGELSYAEAAAVTDLGQVSNGKTNIKYFNELQHFTGLTSIADNVFAGCTGLTEITIPNSVTSIGNNAFYGCDNLVSVTSEIKDPFVFGDDAFNSISGNCVLYVPNGTRDAYIAAGWTEDVFKGGVVEKNRAKDGIIVFADPNVKTICVAGLDTDGDNELSYAEAATLRGIGSYFGFAYNKNQSNIHSFDELQYFTGLTHIGREAFSQCTYLASIKFPDGLTTIEDNAFQNCTSLTSVTFPNSVKIIGSSAFRFCNSLTSINIPQFLTNIGIEAFGSCANLAHISVADGNPVYDSRDNSNCIIETKKNTLVVGCMNSVIPNSVTSIGESAFGNCPGLTSITIPNSITSIGKAAFASCYGLTSVALPNSLITIGDYAFNGSKGLRSITIPNSVTSIGFAAFANCTGIESISIPKSVTSIGTAAFYNCTSLISVTSEIDVPYVFDQIAFSNISDNCVLYVPQGTRDAYIAAGWTEDVFKGGIIENRDIVFADPNVKTICVTNWDTDGDGELSCAEAAAVTDLGQVFNGKTNIKYFNELQHFTGLTSIADNAFNGCAALTSVTIPISVTSIEERAFYGCYNMKNVTFLTKKPFAISSNVFSCKDKATLHVLEELVPTFNELEGWKDFSSIVGEEEDIAAKMDVNADGDVSTADVTAIYSYIINGENSGFTREKANTNGDVDVNTADVTAIYNYIINGSE